MVGNKIILIGVQGALEIGGVEWKFFTSHKLSFLKLMSTL